MNEILTFCKGPAEETEPYHYRACGVDGVYLSNGFERTPDEGYGTGVIISDADELHRIIARSIVMDRTHLGCKDVRFLREQMGKTQRQLGNEIGVSEQMVARYEKADQTDISGPADRLIRILFITEAYPDCQAKIMERIVHLHEDGDNRVVDMVFTRAKKHWASQHDPVSNTG